MQHPMPAGWEERYDRGQCSTAESVDCHGARLKKRPESFTPSLKLKGPDGSFEALENQADIRIGLYHLALSFGDGFHICIGTRAICCGIIDVPSTKSSKLTSSAW